MKLILGTMTFGERIFEADAEKVLHAFLQTDYKEIDTAYVYNNGSCEKMLGSLLKRRDRSSYSIASKVNPRITGRLDEEAVLFQVGESLERLGVDWLDTLYLHFPDENTPVSEALRGCAKLYKEGKIREIGLSNFPARLVEDVCRICQENDWPLPAVYEGLYNPLSRRAEEGLDKLLSACGMRFYAYNPLAGGILTDKYVSTGWQLQEGRFINRPNYQERYWKESYFKAVELINGICSECGISISEASYRWLAFHSMLRQTRGDGIIVGVSGVSQLEANMKALGKGRLPDAVVDAFEKAWEICEADAPEYFRFYKREKIGQDGRKL